MGDSVLRPQQIQSIVEDVIPKFGTKDKIISIKGGLCVLESL